MKERRMRRFQILREEGRPIVLLLTAFSLAILAVLGYALAEMQRASTDTTMNYVQNLTKQLTDMVDLEIGSGRIQLSSIGDSFEHVVFKEDDVGFEEFVTRKQKVCSFDFLVLEDTRKNRVASAGVLPSGYTADPESFRDLKTSRWAQESKTCRAGIEDENVIYAMPLYDEEGQMGFLWAGNTAESMRELICSRSFDGRAYSCIINKNGNLVLASDRREEFQNLAYIFSSGADEKLQADMETMEANIEAGQSGIFRFVTQGGHDVYLAYTPMSGGERVMLTIVPTDLLSTQYDNFVYLATVAVVGTLLVFMGFLILLTRSYRANRRELEHLAFYDEVTGGGNNQDFCRRYRALCRQRDAREYAVALLDVVNFREINKQFGVEQGNAVLRHLHQVITGHLDEEAGEFAARSEMDHFFLCLKEQTPDGVQGRLDAIVAKANTSFEGTHLPRHHLAFRMAASFVEDGETDPVVLEDWVRAVLKMTDAAPGKCAFHSKDFEARVYREQELEGAFEGALAAGDFQVYFQPKVSLGKGSVEGAEALVRWQHPKRGLVPPNEFIPILEGNGKILRLDKYVFEKVCLWIKARQRSGERAIPVSVNLSRSHLLDEDFLSWFVEETDRHGVDHDLIEFELTESSFMDEGQIEKMRDYIARMHAQGFRLSIDDFGTGYSSISLLREFDVDVLKLDRTFFLDIDDRKAQDVVRCLVDLARKLNIRVVVEGIETKKQIDYLKQLSCDVVQGYFFSRPLPEGKFNAWYRGFDFTEYET